MGHPSAMPLVQAVEQILERIEQDVGLRAGLLGTLSCPYTLTARAVDVSRALPEALTDIQPVVERIILILVT